MAKGKKEDLNKFRIKKETKSGLAKFTQRPLPEEEEVSDFEKVVNKEIRREEIEDNLSEIYQDKQGKMVDVTNQNFKKKKSWFLIILKNLLFLSVLAVAAYTAYYYINNQYLNVVELELKIEAPANIKAGEEFNYKIKYKNQSSVEVERIELELILPKSFLLLTSKPEPKIANYWELDNLGPGQSAEIIITGRLLNRANSPNPITARLSYRPSNFSSQFSKEASANTIINDLGFNIALNYFNSVLVGQEAEISLSLLELKENHLNNILLSIDLPNNFISPSLSLAEDNGLEIDEISENRWRLLNLPKNQDRLDFNLKFKVSEKINDEEIVSIKIFHQDKELENRLIWERNLDFEVMQTDFHLSLEINENKNDQAVNLADVLNYRLTYHNRGQAILKDVVLMAVIEGDMIDWSLVDDSLRAKLMDKVIVWTKDQKSDLAELKPDQKGEINFSLQVKDNLSVDIYDYTINSWAQFSFGMDDQDLNQFEDNRSNTILKKINTDLKLLEEIRYFDDNNIPVGSGPLPPQIGEKTSLRVYWSLTNNLNEVEDLEVVFNLPSYINFEGERIFTSHGDLKYNESSHVVIWEISNLPLSILKAQAEFDLSITPNLDDKDKILIISPGSLVRAIDTVTSGEIEYKTNPKTTKLEDDETASWFNTGRVQ